MRDNLGVLLPVSALPADYGIGDFSKYAFQFIDWLKENKYVYWQILPLNPVGPAYSPYLTTCSKAIDIRYIDLEQLAEEKLLAKAPEKVPNSGRISYENAYELKRKALNTAFNNYIKGDISELEKFKKKNHWSVEFAIYLILKEKNNNTPWNTWKKEDFDFFKYNQTIPAKYLKRVNFEVFMQMIARKQWDKILSYAHKNKLKIIADLPFYVGYDSIDCWMNRDQFMMDKNNSPKQVGGCPPDAFNEDGQLWGSPIYNFKKMKKDNYKFLIDRLVYIYKMCDCVRLDHFRAFDTYYVIPAKDKTAKNGVWKKGPGKEFFKLLFKKEKNIELIAEDLGGETVPGVRDLRKKFNLPGMYVFQIGVFSPDLRPDKDTIVYTGTHDSETLYGWLSNLSEEAVRDLRMMFGQPNDLYEKLLKHTINLPSRFTVLPLQDLLMLGNDARINCPGFITNKNWTWKLKDFEILKKKKGF